MSKQAIKSEKLVCFFFTQFNLCCLRLCSFLNDFSERWKGIRNNLKESGSGTAEKNKFVNYEDMNEIYGFRPGFNLRGVDSSKGFNSSGVDSPKKDSPGKF